MRLIPYCSQILVGTFADPSHLFTQWWSEQALLMVTVGILDMSQDTILLIDDDFNICTIVEISLSRQFKVLVAESGLQGIELAKWEKPSLILLDVRMPGMDGIATLNALKEDARTRDIPVVFMSATVQTDEIEAYKKLDIAGIISKPFDPLHLPNLVRAYLRCGSNAHPQPHTRAGVHHLW